MSSLALNMLTFSLDIILSGNEFQSLMAAIVKKFCLAVVLVFLVKTLYGFPRVSLSLIVNSPSVAAASYIPFKILKTSIILPRFLLYSSVGSFRAFSLSG